MAENNYSQTSIHLPENKSLIQLLRMVSTVIGAVIMLCSVVVLVGWLSGIVFLKTLLISKEPLSLFTAVLFFLSSIPLLINSVGRKKIPPFFLTLLLVIFGGLICLGSAAGAFNLIHEENVLVISGGFFIAGCAFLVSQTKLPYRFHIVQLLVFIVTIFSTTILTSFIYRFFLNAPVPHIIYLPLNLTLLFSLLCNALLLRWPNRGFVGIFTTDSTSSMLSLRLLLISVISAPLLGLIGLFWAQNQTYYSYETVVVVAILLMIFLAIFAWVNVKLLYSFELEHFLMKEALRIHNIDLATEQENLSTKIANLEQTKEQYAEKLSNQTKLTDLVDSMQ